MLCLISLTMFKVAPAVVVGALTLISCVFKELVPEQHYIFNEKIQHGRRGEIPVKGAGGLYIFPPFLFI